jgi:hypothetical protein
MAATKRLGRSSSFYQWLALGFILSVSLVCCGLRPVEMLVMSKSSAVRMNTGFLDLPPEQAFLDEAGRAQLMDVPRYFAKTPPRIVAIVGGQEKQVQIKTCSDAIQYLPDAHRILSEYMSREYLSWILCECRAIDRLAKLRPAKSAYLTLYLPDIIKRLAKIKVTPGPSGVRDYFLDFKDAKMPACDPDSDCQVRAGESVHELSAVAVGDYNGDGIQDLVLVDEPWLNEPNKVPLGVVLTAKSDHGDLMVLDWWGGF